MRTTGRTCTIALALGTWAAAACGATGHEWALVGGRYVQLDGGDYAPSYLDRQESPDKGSYQPEAERTGAGVKDDDVARQAVSPVAVEEAPYGGPEGPGTVIVSTSERRLTLVEAGGVARIYGIGVGKEGFAWSGTERVTRKAEWPSWTPPREMLLRRPDLPRHMGGGLNNPLGARALYLGTTLFRIHGTDEPETIGRRVSSGCIRMTNADIMDLYDRVPVGTMVVVR